MMANTMTRNGYSLIELVVAMLAATALLASLAATIVITTELLEVPPDNKAQWHDRAVADRLASDLRFATAIDETYSDGFQISNNEAVTGGSQTVSYQATYGGLTRQVDSGPTIPLDADAPAMNFQVDGYSAPTITYSSKSIQLRASNTASTAASVSSLDIDIPAGCKPGDFLVLCVSAKTPGSITFSDPQWQSLSFLAVNNLRLVTAYRSYKVAMPTTVTINVTPAAAIAAAMISLENVQLSTPIHWSNNTAGFAWTLLPATHPRPLEAAGFLPGQLNVQIFAADGDPWPGGAMGMASFAEAATATAAAGNLLVENSIGIAIRSGATPTLDNPPVLWQQDNGFWMQYGIRLEVAP